MGRALDSCCLIPVPARGLCNHCGTCDCMGAASRFLQHCNLLYTLDIPVLKLKDRTSQKCKIVKHELNMICEVVLDERITNSDITL